MRMQELGQAVLRYTWEGHIGHQYVFVGQREAQIYRLLGVLLIELISINAYGTAAKDILLLTIPA